MLELFPQREKIGVFRGFREGGLEFHADLALPYQTKLHNVPMHGQFLLVQLEHPNEAVLGRITSLSADGRLTSSAGEQYSIRAMHEGRPVSDDLRKEYLKYRVDIRVLGVVRLNDDGEITFVPSHRRLPHMGSPVAFLSDELLPYIASHCYGEGADLGFFALGEYIYAQGDPRLAEEPWMQLKKPCITVKFPITNLVSRRTFVFARAGFGKSNLNKLLFSRLYATTPTTEKRSGRQVPVGTIIFDPDGEYFWPDDKDRPGLCDVPELKDQVVVFTAKQAPSPFYGSFVAGGVKLDIRRQKPSDVISIALSPDKQDQQNVRKLRAMNFTDWSDLVELIAAHGNAADLSRIRELLRLESDQQAEALAARANMTTIVRMLHDHRSQLMDTLLEALAAGKLCIIDVSQLRGGQSLILSGLILRRIFDRNQEEFTKAEPKTIPTIAVVEEAQSVLNDKASASEPYIEWVKEGRKYDLGAILITQQPGSIPTEILSQGDNWFIFHLLSAADLQNVKRANAHFSDDLLSALLNEPIPGQGVLWSSAGKTGDPVYPIPLRVLSFERLYERLDKTYGRPAVETYASRLREKYAADTQGSLESVIPTVTVASDKEFQFEISSNGSTEYSASIDPFRLQQERAIEALKANETFWQAIKRGGIPWGTVMRLLEEVLPATMDDRSTIAYNLVPKAMTKIFGGEQEKAWRTERRSPKNTTFIVKM